MFKSKLCYILSDHFYQLDVKYPADKEHPAEVPRTSLASTISLLAGYVRPCRNSGDAKA